MYDKQQKLDVTQDDLAVIEAALHTQAKILSVQTTAGGSGARRRLNEVKRVLLNVTQQRELEAPKPRRRFFKWVGLARGAT